MAAFPDMYIKTEDMVAEGDKVVERWTISGSYTGAPFFGAPPNGEMDFLGLLQQLGMIPALEQ